MHSALFRPGDQKTHNSTSKQIMLVMLFYENKSPVVISKLSRLHVIFQELKKLEDLGAYPDESQSFVHHLKCTFRLGIYNIIKWDLYRDSPANYRYFNVL